MERFALGVILSILMVCPVVTSRAEAHEDHAPSAKKKIFTKHFQESLFDITQHSSFSIEILLDNEEYDIGRGVTGVVVHDDKNADVTGATLKFVLTNMASGSSASDPVTITEKGEGLYVVSGLNLKREGRWKLAVTVRKGATEDGVTFILPDVLKKRDPKGRYSP